MRAIAVADVFDALSAKRPYREAMPLDKVFAILDRDALDPDCVAVLKDVYRRAVALAAEHVRACTGGLILSVHAFRVYCQYYDTKPALSRTPKPQRRIRREPEMRLRHLQSRFRQERPRAAQKDHLGRPGRARLYLPVYRHQQRAGRESAGRAGPDRGRGPAGRLRRRRHCHGGHVRPGRQRHSHRRFPRRHRQPAFHQSRHPHDRPGSRPCRSVAASSMPWTSPAPGMAATSPSWAGWAWTPR